MRNFSHEHAKYSGTALVFDVAESEKLNKQRIFSIRTYGIGVALK